MIACYLFTNHYIEIYGSCCYAAYGSVEGQALMIDYGLQATTIR